MSLNSASLIISDIDSYLQELSAGSGCKEWKKTNHSGNNSSTPGLNIAPLVAESSNHFEDSCSIKQTNSNGYHQFKESGIPTDYCVEEDNNFMRDFQEAPTFGKMEHYIGSQMYNGKTIQENPFEINNISSSNISIQEDIQAQVEYYKFIKDENKKINYITRNYISWKDWNHEYHGFSRQNILQMKMKEFPI
ncbi:unnamed protein product [[Candida] boidinii]|uniref:Unnamed protein product n=1 Tax=Candida boidinii TaxID=5477 RepID=A0A9W6TAE5_CANBO|nr:unnamed protein product [[Candida] boidinii]